MSLDYRLKRLGEMVEELEFEKTRHAFRLAVAGICGALARERRIPQDWRCDPMDVVIEGTTYTPETMAWAEEELKAELPAHEVRKGSE